MGLFGSRGEKVESAPPKPPQLDTSGDKVKAGLDKDLARMFEWDWREDFKLVDQPDGKEVPLYIPVISMFGGSIVLKGEIPRKEKKFLPTEREYLSASLKAQFDKALWGASERVLQAAEGGGVRAVTNPDWMALEVAELLPTKEDYKNIRPV